MKTAEEIRSITKTFKVSKNEEEIILRNAKEEGLNFSSFCIARAMQRKALTPVLIVKIQNLVNIAYRIIKDSEPDTAKYIKKEMEEIWSYLN